MASKTTTFRAYPPNLRVVMEPARPETRDINNRVVSPRVAGRDIQFHNNVYETSDSEEVKYLRDHELFNTPRGIWEDGNAPDEPKPTTDQQTTKIARLAGKGDVAGLQDLIDEERETHNRVRAVIEPAEEAIAAIEVPKAEEHGKVGREDEPAEESDSVPRVDPAEPPKLEPEIEREKVIKSEKVAEARGEAVAEVDHEESEEPPPTPVEEQIERERAADTAAKTEKAATGKTKKSGKRRTQANTGQRTTASATSEGGGSAKSTASKKSDGADSGESSR